MKKIMLSMALLSSLAFAEYKDDCITKFDKRAFQGVSAIGGAMIGGPVGPFVAIGLIAYAEEQPECDLAIKDLSDELIEEKFEPTVDTYSEKTVTIEKPSEITPPKEVEKTENQPELNPEVNESNTNSSLTLEEPKMDHDTVEALKEIQKQASSLLENKTINFDFDQSIIKDTETLDKISESNLTDVSISVEGHADSRGTKVYNDKLSEKRAKNVTKYLVNKGVEASKINTTWHGETKLLCSEKTEECHTKNRRVEINFSK